MVKWGMRRINIAKLLKTTFTIAVVSFSCFVVFPIVNQPGSAFQAKTLKLQVGYEDKIQVNFKENSTTKDNDIPLQKVERPSENIETKCNSLTYSYDNKIPDGWFKNGIMPLPKFDMSFCRVPKGASTFLTRLLVCLERNIWKPPFIFAPYDTSAALKHTNMRLTVEGIYNATKITKNFMFSRNPYSRVYSFYIDKLFSPNPHFWNAVGKQIARIQRTNSRRSCGHDVTFKEFIQYLLSTPIGRRDYHVVPTNDACRPCKIKYDFIGKLENFEQDVQKMLGELNVTSYPYFNKSFHDEFSADSANDIIHAYTNFRESAVKCMPKTSSLARVWKVLKVRGIISDALQLPVTASEAQDISFNRLLEIVLDASKKSQRIDKEGLKLQKRKYMINAFLTIPLDMMEKLHDIYKEDLTLFGYDHHPKHLFQSRSNHSGTDFLT